MRTITLVTGNKGKLTEWQQLFPKDIMLEAADIDLEEIQSLDLRAIAIDKAKRAYDILGKPLLVEDVAVGIERFGGMPGPFFKYFEVTMGRDALYQLAGREGDKVVATCTIAYYDGHKTITARGETAGTVVKGRGSGGFGFDIGFLPDGYAKTYAEMTPAEKNQCSHRAKAIKAMVHQLRAAD